MFDTDAAIDTAGAEPIAQQPRHRAALAVADRLLGGDLTRAEQHCSDQPLEKREACVDAFLERRDQERSAEPARSQRFLVLLQKFGDSACTHAAPAKHDECVLSAMDGRLKQLAKACPNATPELTQECIRRSLIEQNGP
ncbi:MAG TPA: hypothetical protein VIK01_12210 [Polyangiaceae bacterium]